MVLGVPVVSTKTSGPIEIIDNDKYGILCDHDEESMFNAVLTMVNDADLRRHYAMVGKERVKKYAAEECMKQIYLL
jgi:glycosyltransferase involved in cell wall biosynthesis